MRIRDSKNASVTATVLCAASLGLPTIAAADGKKFTAWTDPIHLGGVVNSSSRELTPELSPDGLSLYFISNRPGGFGIGTFDVWVSHRACEASPWEAPVPIGPNINSSGDEIAPSFSPDGHLLFFASDQGNEPGDTDIWVSYRTDTHDDFDWGPPVNLGPHVNTAEHETSPAFLKGKGKHGRHTLFFVRSTADEDDIYETSVTGDGLPLWPGMPVVELNIPGVLDGDPAPRGDGREMIFFSGRAGGLGAPGTLDIWVSTRRNIHHPWSMPENLGAPVNTTFADFTPSLTFDGLQLFFVSAAARGGLGLQDIWMSTREIIKDDDEDEDDD